MILSFFTIDIMGITSYNIHISSTQSYVPDSNRGRFNGIFQMICVAGGIVGQLISGSLAEFISERSIVLIFMAINILAVIFVMYKGHHHVKNIYNRSV